MTWDLELHPEYVITDIPSVPEEFTPTAEEWFWSMVYPDPVGMITDKSGETMFYFATNMSAAAVSTWYTAGESFQTYRWMSMASRTPAVARAMPVLAAPVVGVALATSVAGATVSAASGQSPGNPWWIPLPLYLTLFG